MWGFSQILPVFLFGRVDLDDIQPASTPPVPSNKLMPAQMQLPFHGQSLGMPAQLPSSGDMPGSFPSMGYGHNASMDSLDCLGDVGLFPPQESDSMPDYSDLNQAASQMQVRSHARTAFG